MSKRGFKITPEHLAFFHDKYVTFGPRIFVEKFAKEFGLKMTYHRARSIASKHGISGYHAPPGFYTVAEAAYLLNIGKKVLEQRILNNTLKTRHVGRRHFISEEDFDKLHQYYSFKEPPWPALTTKEAAKILGVRATSLCHAVKKGHLLGIKIQAIWYLNKEQILWGAKYAKETGNVCIPWSLYNRQRISVSKAPMFPWECITTIEAAKVLGLKQNTAVWAAWKRGSLEGVMYKNKLYVRKETIYKLKELREKSGSHVDWHVATEELNRPIRKE